MIKHYINSSIFVAAVAFTLLFFKTSEWFTVILICLFAVFFIVLSIGILFLRYHYFLPAICKLKNGKVLLTFDDGPDENHTPKILTILEKHNVGALFFIIGKKAKKQPIIISEILAQGHQLGNHTQQHSNFFTFFGTDKVVQEITDCSKTIQDQNHAPLELFRPPIGYSNPNISRGIKRINTKRKLKVIGWNFRSYDTIFKTPERLKKRLLKGIAPNQIILLHDNLAQTSAILDDFISTSKKNGIIFVQPSEINTLF